MNETDYIIVGDGYAALFFAHQLIKHNKKFQLYSEGRKSASQVSAGIVNPVVLKKFTTFWLANVQIKKLHQTFSEIEKYTGKNYLIEEPIHRIFHDESEKVLWQKKRENSDLIQFLDPDTYYLEGINNNYGTGKVNFSARLDVAGFFTGMLAHVESIGSIKREKFDYSQLYADEKLYKGVRYSKLIFCEGMGVTENPFFSYIPVKPNKGHHLKVQLSGGFNQKVTLKKKHFLFPLAEDEFYYGGTYDREQIHLEVDETAKEQLVNGLKEIIPQPFLIKDVHFGFRPTVKDRRPILGTHPEFSSLYVFNGLGARGILNGNYFAGSLFDLTEHSISLPEEVDLKRFAE